VTKSHNRKNVLNLTYIQHWEGYFGNGNVIADCYKLPVINVDYFIWIPLAMQSNFFLI